MGSRIDHTDNPDAPEANSLVPSVNTIVRNDRGDILLIRRTDNGNWSLPGGAMDLGESVGQAAVRETLEETGITTELTGISGIYSNPRHLVEYTSDGEVRQEFSIVFTGRPVSGDPTPSDESSEVVWLGLDRLDELTMHESMRQRIAARNHRGRNTALGLMTGPYPPRRCDSCCSDGLAPCLTKQLDRIGEPAADADACFRHPSLGVGTRTLEIRSASPNRLCHETLGSVPLLDLSDSPFERHPHTVGSGREIAVGERLIEHRVLKRKFRRELGDAPELCLVTRARVVGNQGRQARAPP